MEHYFPFDSGRGTTVTSEQWSQLTSLWQTDGIRTVRKGDDGLPLSASVTGQDMTVNLRPGHATIQGFHYYSDTTSHVAIAPNTGTQTRLDRITIRLDRPGQRIALAYLQGTPAAQPQPPALAQGENGVWDIPLARITVRPQTGAITPADVTDDRLYTGWGISLSRSSSRPVPGYSGQLLYEADSERLRLHATIDDTAGPDASWRTIADTAATMTPFQPTCNIVEFSSVTGSYRIAGANLVYVELSLTAGSDFTLARNLSINPTLPFTAGATARQFIDGLRWNADQSRTPNMTGCKLAISSGARTGMYIQQNTDSAGDWNAESLPFRRGDQVYLSGLYSVADGQL